MCLFLINKLFNDKNNFLTHDFYHLLRIIVFNSSGGFMKLFTIFIYIFFILKSIILAEGFGIQFYTFASITINTKSS